ncbi:ketoacyl-ACP synthase III family protein [Glycomyces paridis]|uniref:3-oxoacyl-ACP synthase n=1 Tax=Glycomyces paridis TaxID=2126555 RepID=A0A4S8PJP6_9ACTN|nr:ketoacyl-ACP synthase III family protein [Glycomyces paridis]THV30221.1 3-oxoacyl-ACP synthase [Glycomyces paridis]
MTAILDVGSFIPPTGLTVREVAAELDLDGSEVRLIERFFGIEEVRTAPGLDYAERLEQAVLALPSWPEARERVRYVVTARTYVDTTAVRPEPVHRLTEKLGLQGAQAMTIVQHACASGLLAVETAGELLADEDPDALALVLCGEVPTVDHRYIPRTTFMGDSTAALLVTAGPGPNTVRSHAWSIATDYGDMSSVVDSLVDSELVRRVQREYAGHAEAAAPHDYTEEVCAVVHEAVKRADLTLDEIALVLPHNVNRISWVRICRRLGLPLDKVLLDLVTHTGHCYTADAFLNLAEARRQGRLAPGDAYLAVGVGLGGIYSAMALTA